MRRFSYCRKRIESGILKKAIESADYYPDSRKRRHYLMLHYEEGNMTSRRLRSLDYGRFSARRTLFWSFLRHARLPEVKVAD